MMRELLPITALAGALLMTGAAATPPTDAIVDAATAYVAFRSDAEAIGAAPLATAADLDHALQRAGRHNPDALSRGWIAYGALIAEKSPAFAAGVRAVSERYGRTAVLRALAADPAYPTRRRGYNHAVSLLLASDADIRVALRRDVTRWETVADAVDSLPGGVDAQERAAMLRRSDEAPYVATTETRADLATLAPPAADEKLRAVVARAAIVRRMTALAAMRVLGAGDEWRASMDRMMTDPTSRDCVRLEQLQFYQCVSVTENAEPAYCLSRHAIEGVGACVTGLSRSATVPMSAGGINGLDVRRH